VQENLLVKMVAALYKVQAAAETLIYWGGPALRDYEQHFRNEPRAVEQLANSYDMERILAPYKMDILQGLACLKRPHLQSYETVLDALYHIFKRNGNLLVLEQVCVLLTGMGLVNEHGRWAFCQAVNACCATLFQLYYYEVDRGVLPLFQKSMMLPSYGRHILSTRHHTSKFKPGTTLHLKTRKTLDAAANHKAYERMIFVLSQPPEASGLTSRGAITKFYNEIAEIDDPEKQFVIRSILDEDQKPQSSRRQRRFAILDSA